MTTASISLSELDNGACVVTLDDEEVAVFRVGGEVYALAHRCPHSAGPLGIGKIVDGEVVCPWHGARFRLADGRCTAGPSTDVRAFEARIDGGEVVVGHRPNTAHR